MTTKEKIDSISSKLNQLPNMTKICHEVALALIETNQVLAQQNAFCRFFEPTEYDRARNRIISLCQSASSDLKSLRRDSFSTDAIKAAPVLNKIFNCCQKCATENQKNITFDKPFCCLLENAQLTNMTESFRFMLDKKGQIIEHI